MTWYRTSMTYCSPGRREPDDIDPSENRAANVGNTCEKEITKTSIFGPLKQQINDRLVTENETPLWFQ